jgi:hypothetical protein
MHRTYGLNERRFPMAFWESVTESIGGVSGSTILLGAAAVVLAPIVAPAVLAGVRPVAKTVLKGGIYVYDQVSEMVAEAGEGVVDIVAEARAEMAESAAANSGANANHTTS